MQRNINHYDKHSKFQHRKIQSKLLYTSVHMTLYKLNALAEALCDTAGTLIVVGRTCVERSACDCTNIVTVHREPLQKKAKLQSGRECWPHGEASERFTQKASGDQRQGPHLSLATTAAPHTYTNTQAFALLFILGPFIYSDM